MKITVETAAKILDKSPQFIRIGLQRKLLPFGFAVRIDERRPRSRLQYFINPKDFADYVGVSLKEIERRVAE